MAKRKVKLADVIWEAANVHLRANEYDYGKSHYTCDCIRYAVGLRNEGKVFSFLQKLGFPKGAINLYDLFSSFREIEKRQGVRYMWLLLAMKVAEDENIYIEVESA